MVGACILGVCERWRMSDWKQHDPTTDVKKIPHNRERENKERKEWFVIVHRERVKGCKTITSSRKRHNADKDGPYAVHICLSVKYTCLHRHPHHPHPRSYIYRLFSLFMVLLSGEECGCIYGGWQSDACMEVTHPHHQHTLTYLSNLLAPTSVSTALLLRRCSLCNGSGWGMPEPRFENKVTSGLSSLVS